MNRWLREFRIVPVVLIAAGCLFALKAIGLLFDGGYTLGQRLARTDTLVVTTVPVTASVQLQSPSSPLDVAAAQSGDRKPSWMQEMFNYPDVTGSIANPARSRESVVVTGSIDPPAGAKEAAAKPTGKAEPPKGQQPPETRPAAGTTIALDTARSTSPAERAILERLHDRRQELDTRARQLDLRESLLKAAEKKLEVQLGEIKQREPPGGPPGQRKQDVEQSRFKSLVTMYETMKPKEAAKIFDRLEIRVLIEVASQINPRRMSEILAQMTPEAAEKLTVELAARAQGIERSVNPADLPKIEGRPTGG